MTESEWRTTNDVVAMVRAARLWSPCWACEGTNVARPWDEEKAAVVEESPCPECGGGYRQDRPSERKVRLFACACCRAVWPLLTGEPARRAVEAAERYADGLCGRAELEQTWRQATSPLAAAASQPESAWQAAQEAPAQALRRFAAAWDADTAARRMEEALRAGEEAMQRARELSPLPSAAALKAVRRAAERKVAEEMEREKARAVTQARRAQAAALRDLLGNPFRPCPIAAAWAEADGGRVRAIAEVIYAEGRFGDLPVLADALEEAGCSDEPVLAHCRGPGGHYRGCWVVDGLLAKG